MSCILQVRVDDDLKLQASMVYEQLGIDLSTAIRMFLTKSVVVNGVPFEMKNDSSTNKAIAAMESMGQTSLKNKNSNMSLDKINEIIRKTRLEKKR